MGELIGYQNQPREIAAACYAAGPLWRPALVLVTAVAVCLSESQGHAEAINWNYKKDDGEFVLDENGEKIVDSEDHGPWQLNTKAHPHITIEEAQNLKQATSYAYKIFRDRDNTFNAWYGFLGGAYLMDSYIRNAARGVGNFLAEEQLKRQAKHPKLVEREYVSYLEVPVLDYRAGSYSRPES